MPRKRIVSRDPRRGVLRHGPTLLAAGLAWSGLAFAAVAQPAARPCIWRLAATATLRSDDGFISLPVTIGGVPASMLLDTGSDGGLLTQAGATRLGLSPDARQHVALEGTGGSRRSLGVVRIPDLVIGGMRLAGGSLPVGMLPGMPVLTPPVAGLLGADVLAGFDVEFDLPHRRIAFWIPHSGAACGPPPGWSASGDGIPLTREGDRLALSATLDGRPITALVDTGARSRILSVRAAARLGVAGDRLGADPGGITAGIDLHESPYHWHRFASLTVGGETIRDPVLTVAPQDERVDLLLGADWFATRDVWISWNAARMFVRVQAGAARR